jgi:hypothetical protein
LARRAPVGDPEQLAERARNVNEASALFPASPSFFELAGTGIFGMPTFAFRAMTAVQFKRHIRPANDHSALHAIAR